MRTGRPKAVLALSSDERAHLLVITRSRSLPAALTLLGDRGLAPAPLPHRTLIADALAAAITTVLHDGAMRERAEAALHSADDYIHENPWRTLAIVGGVALIAGALIARGGSR